METVLLVIIFVFTFNQLHCQENNYGDGALMNGSYNKIYVNGEVNLLRDLNKNLEKDPKTVLLVSDFTEVNFTTLKSTTVVVPLKESFLEDERFIKVLSSAPYLLLTLEDGLSLNTTETFMQKFWRQHKTTKKLLVKAPNKIYFFDPFAYDCEAKAYGKLQSDVKRRRENFPLRVEYFPSVYSEPLNWKNWKEGNREGYKGPDINIANIIFEKMKIQGEITSNFINFHNQFVISQLIKFTMMETCLETDSRTALMMAPLET